MEKLNCGKLNDNEVRILFLKKLISRIELWYWNESIDVFINKIININMYI